MPHFSLGARQHRLRICSFQSPSVLPFRKRQRRIKHSSLTTLLISKCHSFFAPKYLKRKYQISWVRIPQKIRFLVWQTSWKNAMLLWVLCYFWFPHILIILETWMRLHCRFWDTLYLPSFILWATTCCHIQKRILQICYLRCGMRAREHYLFGRTRFIPPEDQIIISVEILPTIQRQRKSRSLSLSAGKNCA